MYKYLSILIIAFIGYGCNDPLTIGTETENPLDVSFTDTISLHTATVAGDIVSTYILGINYSTYLLGNLDDPYFGKSSSDIYLEINGAAIPSFKKVTVDSMLLVIKYDTLGIYGDTTAMFNIEVREVVEGLSGDTIKSDRTFETNPEVIGSISLVPAPYDSLVIKQYGDIDSNLTILPQLRIPMTQMFIDKIITADPDNYIDPTALLAFIKGLQITATVDGSSMIGLNLSDATNVSGNNALRLYYRDSMDVKRTFDFSFRARTFSNFKHDYTDAIIEPYINDKDHNGDDFAFFQGMSGVETEVTFPSIREFESYIINKAEIVYYSTVLPEVTGFVYDPIRIAATTYVNEEGNVVLTSDASLGVSPGPYASSFGGLATKIENENIYITKVNLTNQINTILNNPKIEAKIKITPLQRSERSGRTIIFGSGAATYKPVLKLTYTKI